MYLVGPLAEQSQSLREAVECYQAVSQAEDLEAAAGSSARALHQVDPAEVDVASQQVEELLEAVVLEEEDAKAEGHPYVVVVAKDCLHYTDYSQDMQEAVQEERQVADQEVSRLCEHLQCQVAEANLLL